MSVLKSRYFETFKQAGIFGLGTLSNRLVGFLLLPLYTSRLSTDDYGILALLTTTSVLLSAFLQMGLSTATFKHYFSTDDLKHRQKIVSTALFWQLGVTVSFAVFWAMFAEPLSVLILGEAFYPSYIQIVGLTLVFSVPAAIPTAILRAERRAVLYSALSLSTFVISTTLNIYFVAVAQQGVWGVLIATLLGTVFHTLASIWFCRHSFTFVFSRETIDLLLKFGLPLVPSAMSSFVLGQADRYFLRYFSTLSEIGVYSLGYKIGMSLNFILVQPFQLVWLPMALEAERQKDAEKFYTKMLTYVLVIASWIALGLSLLGREAIVLISSPTYYDAYKTIPWIAFSYVFYAAYMVVNIGIYLKSKTHWAIWIVGSAALLNLFANFLLIPPWGTLGAAVANLIAYIWLFVFSWQVNSRIYFLRYEWSRIIKLLCVTIIVLVLGTLSPQNLIVAVMVKGFLLLLFWEILLGLGFFERSELNVAHDLFAAVWRRILPVRTGQKE